MKAKKILGILFLFLLVIAGIGIYLVNKGPLDIDHAEGTKINAAALYAAFSNDTSKAIKEYSGKVLDVTGQVDTIAFNQQKQKIIMLKTGSSNAFINCTLEEENVVIEMHSIINIKGICSGIGQGDEDMGIKGDVYLTRCILTN